LDIELFFWFYYSPNVSQSSPPIALLPGGPELEKDRLLICRPIDDIIKAVLESGSINKKKNKDDDKNQWPYISDNVVLEHSNWIKCDHLTTDIGVR
jgi:hypothetical protein